VIADLEGAFGDDLGVASVGLGDVDLVDVIGRPVLEGQLAVTGEVGTDGVSRQLGERLMVL